MSTVLIRPGGPLRGSVTVGGSKNAALPILAAALLCRSPLLLHNLPDIRDVEGALCILVHMGASIHRIGRHTVRIDPRDAEMCPVTGDFASQMRGSLYFLGASLARFGEGAIGHVGGCNFGTRPIDQHLKAFHAMGAEVDEADGRVVVRGKELRGAIVRFDTVSVGATVNAILAATAAKGETLLQNTAREPHIDDLISFLNAAGADIQREEDDAIRIRGGRSLLGPTYTVLSDMIEAGTYLIAGAATGGAVRVRGVETDSLRLLGRILSEMGAELDFGEREVTLFARESLFSHDLETGPYPAFPTDLQPQMGALFSCVTGRSRITETVWDQRFRYIDELRKMGADIQTSGNIAEIKGGRLCGATVKATDLRAGAALLIAALAAEGESCIENAELIARGYEDYVEKFTWLGGELSLLP